MWIFGPISCTIYNPRRSQQHQRILRCKQKNRTYHCLHNIPLSVYNFYTLRCAVTVLDACQYTENGTLLTSPRCANNGGCVNGAVSPGEFDCNCTLGYTGQLCEEGQIDVSYMLISLWRLGVGTSHDQLHALYLRRCCL